MKIMLNFTNVVEEIKSSLYVKPIKAKLLQLTEEHTLLVTEPLNKLESYQDIVAQIILCKNNTVLENKLIAYDTDLEAVIQKLKKKIETSEERK